MNASHTKNPGIARMVRIHLERLLQRVQTHMIITPSGRAKTKSNNVTIVRTPFEGPEELFEAIILLRQNYHPLSIDERFCERFMPSWAHVQATKACLNPL